MSARRQLASMSDTEELIVDRLETALWVYDFERGSITWANRRALELWDADSIAELAGRKLHNEMSPSVRTRLAQHMDDFRLCPDREIREFWTLYPGGKPFRVRATLRRYELPFGRVGMLVEAHKEELTQPETIRSAESSVPPGLRSGPASAGQRLRRARIGRGVRQRRQERRRAPRNRPGPYGGRQALARDARQALPRRGLGRVRDPDQPT